MEDLNQAKRIQVSLCNRQVTADLGTEISLPDYQPEVKRLLRVNACVGPFDSFVGSSGGDFSGRVEYEIFYAGNDGGLYCIHEGEDVSFRVPFEIPSDVIADEGFSALVSASAEGVSGRVNGPRKITVKGRLKANVSVLGMKAPNEDFPTGAEVEKLCGSTESARRFFGDAEPMKLVDEVTFENEDGDLRVISADGRLLFSDVSAGSGCINCRGEVSLKLLTVFDASEELPTVQFRRIPFATVIPADGAEVNCSAVAEGYCQDVGVMVEDGKITVEVTVCLHGEANRNERFDYVKDAYCAGAESTGEFDLVTVPVCLNAGNGNFSVNESKKLSECKIPASAVLLDAEMTPTVTGFESTNGKNILIGKNRVQVIFSDGKEMGSKEFELPFRYETVGEKEDASEFDASSEAVSCRVKSDGEKLTVDGEIAVSFAFRKEREIRRMKSETVGDGIKKDASVLKVCYPESGDTLWSLSKRYAVPIEKVVKTNRLPDAPAADTPESLTGVRFLLI